MLKVQFSSSGIDASGRKLNFYVIMKSECLQCLTHISFVRKKKPVKENMNATSCN